MDDSLSQFFEEGGELKFAELLGDIPFGQSEFQNIHLQITQENEPRTYRQILLEMSDKFKALKECQFRRRRMEVKKLWLERLHTLLVIVPSLRTLVKVSLDDTRFKIIMENKLLEDAMYDFTMYKGLYDKMKKMTREDYNKEEHAYWQRRAIRQAEEDIIAIGTISVGNIQFLKKMGLDPNEVKVDLLAIVNGAQKQIAAKRQEQLEAAKKEAAVAKEEKPE